MLIRCCSCGETIFEFLAEHKHARSLIEASDFKALAGNDPKPDEKMLCPLCGNQFYGSPGVCLQTEDGAWWPHPPVALKEK